MQIVRFSSRGSAESAAVVGVLDDAGELRSVQGFASLAELWQLTTTEIRQVLGERTGRRYSPAEVRFLPPVDGSTEVWAAGVTYEASKYARSADSVSSKSVYEDVYHAERPELFFKSTAWRVVGDGDPVAVRSDSPSNVPEPELALVLNSSGELVGYTVCNDVSSRTLEAENPLYLPQAKIYLGACSIGPSIRPAWEVPEPYALAIRMEISRGGEPVWAGEGSTSMLHRSFEELTRFLLHADTFPAGVLLATGTCLVPPAPFTLTPGDVVSIEIAEVGRLTNHVVSGIEDMAWLVSRAVDGQDEPRREPPALRSPA